jgi:hypothetical protein
MILFCPLTSLSRSANAWLRNAVFAWGGAITPSATVAKRVRIAQVAFTERPMARAVCSRLNPKSRATAPPVPASVLQLSRAAQQLSCRHHMLYSTCRAASSLAWTSRQHMPTISAACVVCSRASLSSALPRPLPW